METMVIKPTHKAPRIEFDLRRGIIQLTGNATEPEFKSRFEILSRWIELYCRVPNKTTRVDIDLEEVDQNWQLLLGHLLWYLVNLHETKRSQLTIFWFMNEMVEKNPEIVEEIERKLNFKIHKLSNLLT